MTTSYRVLRTSKEASAIGGSHRHIAGLCLEDGRVVAKALAINRIKGNVEAYYTFEAGLRAEVEVASGCAMCAAEYLRTDKDDTIKNNLLQLPDC